MSWWDRGAGAGRGLVDADNSTRPRQETAGEGIPARAQWRRRRATGGALAIDMASLRSVGRCERFGALQRRMPLAPHASRSPLAHHTCCVFIERHSRRSPGMQGCRLPRPSTSTYLGSHARNARPPTAVRGAGDARLFIICHNGRKNSTRAKQLADTPFAEFHRLMFLQTTRFRITSQMCHSAHSDFLTLRNNELSCGSR